ncbi:hypothetical protein [Ideonella livida]|uniref:Uncharacterized protein n=1 Tax=Ideonella livida TaxID=2707176 RepID=A0A7C9PEK1_9BURK|nr:hypothetical protein [Ideonella livida]NDY89709.1 hypothetical protein [Ideonella livida]
MQPKIVIYKSADIARVVSDATASQTEAQWRERLLGAVAKAINADRRAYLNYGPYWWPVKGQLVAAGLLPWASAPDPDLVAQVTLGGDSLDLAAGVTYQGFNIDSMRTGQSTFSVDTDDGDTIDYVLYDEEAEAMAMV